MTRLAAFRCDGGKGIGNGHILRCLLLAKELKKKNINSIFFCQKITKFLSEQIKKNFKLNILKNNSHTELKKKLLNGCEYLIIDHRSIEKNFEKKIIGWAKRIIIIEDIIHNKHSADLIINYNFGVKQKDYIRINDRQCIFLTGLKYSIINNEIKRQKKIIKSSKKKTILISFGGYDGKKITLKIINYLKNLYKKNIKAIILLNRNDTYYHRLKKTLETIQFSYEIHTNQKISKFLSKIDFAIISGGTISKEIIISRIPCGIISTSNDQLLNTTLFKKISYAKYICHWNKLSEKKFFDCFYELLKLNRKKIKLKKNNFFDFGGGSRISKIIFNL